MIRFELQIESASPGWATILLHTDNHKTTIPCSEFGGDCLGEITRAFLALAEGDERAAAEIDCNGEPENTLIRLKKNGLNVEVSVTRYSWEGDRASEAKIQRAIKTGKPKDWAKMQRSRNKKTQLRHSSALTETIASLVQAFQSIEDRLGTKQYESIWGFEFPSTQLANLQQHLPTAPN